MGPSLWRLNSSKTPTHVFTMQDLVGSGAAQGPVAFYSGHHLRAMLSVRHSIYGIQYVELHFRDQRFSCDFVTLGVDFLCAHRSLVDIKGCCMIDAVIFLFLCMSGIMGLSSIIPAADEFNKAHFLIQHHQTWGGTSYYTHYTYTYLLPAHRFTLGAWTLNIEARTSNQLS